MKQRDLYIDFLKGIAIIMVIGIHSYNMDNHIYALFLRESLNCAVPIFITLSGFMLAGKQVDSRESRNRFWRKQMPKVYIPTVLWSVPYFIIAIKNGTNPLIAILLLLVCGYSIYYYIAVSIQNYLLLPIVNKCKYGGGILIVTIVSLLSISYTSFYYGLDLPLIIDGGICFTWFWFFYLGVKLRSIKRNYNICKPMLICIFGLILSVFETIYLIKLNNCGYGANKLSSYIFSSGIILLLLSNKLYRRYENHVFSFIAKIGQMSFGIYLTHCFVLTLVNKLHCTQMWIAKWLLVAIITVLCVSITRRYLPHKVLKYIGF